MSNLPKKRLLTLPKGNQWWINSLNPYPASILFKRKLAHKLLNLSKITSSNNRGRLKMRRNTGKIKLQWKRPNKEKRKWTKMRSMFSGSRIFRSKSEIVCYQRVKYHRQGWRMILLGMLRSCLIFSWSPRSNRINLNVRMSVLFNQTVKLIHTQRNPQSKVVSAITNSDKNLIFLRLLENLKKHQAISLLQTRHPIEIIQFTQEGRVSKCNRKKRWCWKLIRMLTIRKRLRIWTELIKPERASK